jgi:hypothetical protein
MQWVEYSNSPRDETDSGVVCACTDALAIDVSTSATPQINSRVRNAYV